MEFKLPDIGEGVVEGELIQWLVKEGDTVAADQPVVEVMTDKATVEVPAPVGGKITGISAKEGDMIKVGQTLAQIAASATAAEAPKAVAPKAAAPEANKTVEKTEKPSGGEGAGRDQSSLVQDKTATMPASTSQLGSYSSPASLSPSDVPAAPIVRAMAQKAGVDLGQVNASGPKVGNQNRVLEEDLLKFLNQGAGAVQAGSPVYAPQTPSLGAASAPAKKAIKPLPASFIRNVGGPVPQDERQPVRGLRRVIAQAMVRSKFTAPHYSYVDKFECSALMEMREEAKKIGEQYGVKVSYLPFIVKALVGALKEFPTANSSLEENDKGMELVLKKQYHIGIAVATPDGLIVPVIKNADQKTILQISQEINDLSAKARAGKATADELRGSTFTITSMGNIGGLFATPIINYPEVGIMGVYKIQQEALVQNGEIVIGNTMHLSLSLDHRVVDGAVGGYFCNSIIERLQNPARLLMEMI